MTSSVTTKRTPHPSCPVRFLVTRQQARRGWSGLQARRRRFAPFVRPWQRRASPRHGDPL